MGARLKFSIYLFSTMHPLWLTVSLLIISLPAAGQNTPEEVRAAIKNAGGSEAFISMLADKTAKITPKQLDQNTELFGATATESTIIYYVRILDAEKPEIASIPDLKRRISTTSGPAVCTAPTATVLINEYGAEYKYIFYSKTRQHLFHYVLNKKTCAQGGAQ